MAWFIYEAAFFLVAFVVALVFCWLSRRLAISIGLLDQPGDRKIHCRAMPYGGGIALWGSMSACLAVGWLLRSWLEVYLGDTLSFDHMFDSRESWAIAAGACLIFLLGLLDDFWSLPAKPKLIFQVIVIGWVAWMGPQVTIFSTTPWIGWAATVVWVVLITNAFNLIDNMDGLCCTIALSALFSHWIILHENGQILISALSVLMIASLLAFLFFNFPPAKMFLGDSGSLLIGYSIAQLSVLSTYYRQGMPHGVMLAPFLILAIPLYDVGTVMYIRFKNKSPFFTGDRNHFSHRLLALGMSTKQILLFSFALSVILGINAYLMRRFSWCETGMIVLQVFFILSIIRILEHTALKRNQREA